MIKIFARAGGKDTCWNMKCIKKWNLITAKTKTKTKINFVFHFHSTTVGRFVSHRLGLYRKISFSPFLEYFTFHFLFWLLLSLLHTFFYYHSNKYNVICTNYFLKCTGKIFELSFRTVFTTIMALSLDSRNTIETID